MEHLKQFTEAQSNGLRNGSTHSGIRWDVSSREIAGNMISQFGINEVHRQHLAELAFGYANSQADFIADKVCPFVPVTALAGKYRKWDDRMFFDRPETSAGKDTPPTRVSNASSLINYDLSGRALSYYMSNVDRDDAINQYGSVNAWRAAITKQLTHLLLIDRELTVAALLQTSGNYNFSATASPLWSDAAADYQANIFTAEDAIYSQPANILVMGYDVARQCQKSPQIKGASTVAVASGNRSKNLPFVTMEAVSNFFDKPVITSPTRYNSAPESSSMTLSYIWANYVAVLHTQMNTGSPEFDAPFCVSFKLQSASFPNVQGFTVKSVMDTAGSMAGGELMMVGYWCQEKVFAENNGYLLKAL